MATVGLHANCNKSIQKQGTCRSNALGSHFVPHFLLTTCFLCLLGAWSINQIWELKLHNNFNIIYHSMIYMKSQINDWRDIQGILHHRKIHKPKTRYFVLIKAGCLCPLSLMSNTQCCIWSFCSLVTVS